MNLKLLAEPFPESEIEWRIGQSGVSDTKGPWAKVLAYITNRAIMDRLDEVCGPENWRNEFCYAGAGVLCGLSVKISDEWITKWDGAENTDIEAVKGGLSNAMKRAAVQWGIGRYLYGLSEGWAKIGPEGANYVKANKDKGTPPFHWDPPNLPKWALPAHTDEKAQPSRPVAPPAAKLAPTDEPAMPADHVVKGKRLRDYTTPELNDMQKALRAEGKSQHKQLLADIVTVLNDRVLGPSKKNAPPLSDEARGELVRQDKPTPALPFA
jgi:hypothetical protein